MVLGAILAQGTSRLYTVEDTKSTVKYTQIVEGQKLSQIQERYGGTPWIFNKTLSRVIRLEH